MLEWIDVSGYSNSNSNSNSSNIEIINNIQSTLNIGTNYLTTPKFNFDLPSNFNKTLVKNYLDLLINFKLTKSKKNFNILGYLPPYHCRFPELLDIISSKIDFYLLDNQKDIFSITKVLDIIKNYHLTNNLPNPNIIITITITTNNNINKLASNYYKLLTNYSDIISGIILMGDSIQSIHHFFYYYLEKNLYSIRFREGKTIKIGIKCQLDDSNKKLYYEELDIFLNYLDLGRYDILLEFPSNYNILEKKELVSKINYYKVLGTSRL